MSAAFHVTRGVRFLLAASLLLAPGPGRAACDELLAAPTEGFGAPGPYPAREETFPSPRWPRRRVSVFLPEGHEGKAPVIFFAHGFGGTQPLHYRALLEHLASRGNAVVFSPYPSFATRHADRYDTLWEGFRAAAARYAHRLDLGQVGFVGHSFGGGATPAMANRGLVDEGWGKQAAFLAMLAPWYVLELPPESLAAWPPHVNLLIQVYEEERVNDHRIAIGFFQAVPIPKPRKDFVLVPSASRNGCELAARHRTPVTGGPLGDFDAHDQRAVFRLLDALVDASFENDEKGRVVALGGGAEPQIDMGTWADGTPVVPLVAGDDPAPARPEEHYRFRRSHRSVWVVRDDIGNAVGE